MPLHSFTLGVNLVKEAAQFPSIPLFRRSYPAETFRWMTGPQTAGVQTRGMIQWQRCSLTKRKRCDENSESLRTTAFDKTERDKNGPVVERGRLHRQRCCDGEDDDMMEPAHSENKKNPGHKGVCDDYSRHPENPSVKLAPTVSSHPPAAPNGAVKTINRQKLPHLDIMRVCLPLNITNTKGLV